MATMKKKMVEKKTKDSSKEMLHEKGEGKKEQMKEYGKVKRK